MQPEAVAQCTGLQVTIKDISMHAKAQRLLPKGPHKCNPAAYHCQAARLTQPRRNQHINTTDVAATHMLPEGRSPAAIIVYIQAPGFWLPLPIACAREAAPEHMFICAYADRLMTSESCQQSTVACPSTRFSRLAAALLSLLLST